MSAQTGIDNPLNALIPVIATAVERWREDHSPKQIEANNYMQTLQLIKKE